MRVTTAIACVPAGRKDLVNDTRENHPKTKAVSQLDGVRKSLPFWTPEAASDSIEMTQVFDDHRPGHFWTPGSTACSRTRHSASENRWSVGTVATLGVATVSGTLLLLVALNPSLIQSAARPVLAGIRNKTASLTKDHRARRPRTFRLPMLRQSQRHRATSQSSKAAAIQPSRRLIAAHAQAATAELNGPGSMNGLSNPHELFRLCACRRLIPVTCLNKCSACRGRPSR